MLKAAASNQATHRRGGRVGVLSGEGGGQLHVKENPSANLCLTYMHPVASFHSRPVHI